MLDQFRVNAAPWQQGSAGVPEIVPAYIRETSTFQQRLKVAVYYVLSV
jgi:hypothetical protein